MGCGGQIKLKSRVDVSYNILSVLQSFILKDKIMSIQGKVTFDIKMWEYQKFLKSGGKDVHMYKICFLLLKEVAAAVCNCQPPVCR